MSNFKCQYCPRYFSNRAYSQHVDRCVFLYDISTEESINDVSSDANNMSLDSDDFNRVEDLQNILASGSEIRENPSVTQDIFEEYDGDVSLISQSISIIPRRF